MSTILNLFNVNTIFITIGNYPMSYIEFFGTILNLISVWLVGRRNILTWPIGIAAVILFALLFYQIQLYSDLIEQIYFIITGFYGWWVWIKLTRSSESKVGIERKIAIKTVKSQSQRIIWLSFITVGTILMGFTMSRIDLILPSIFPEPASYPYLDALTTIMSFAAQILMAHRYIESWALWILVDIIGIWLYYAKGVVFVSLLYFIFLILAIKGLLNWMNN